MSTAAVLPLSRAEVERVFSQVKLAVWSQKKGIFTGQIGKVWSQKSHETGPNEQYFTCQTKLQQTMLWACVRYSS